MPCIEPLTVENASPDGAEILNAIMSKIGMIPNLYATMAHSPAALSAVLAFSDALGKSVLSAKIREQLALAIAGVNNCDYCASAHSAIGKMSGLDESEVAKNLTGVATDPKVQALLTLARSIVVARGKLAGSELEEARASGVTDPEIVEVIAAVSLNTMTNYLNHIAETAIDFPIVRTAEAVS